MLVHAIPSNATYEFSADVRAGLTRIGQKELPSKYLYDDVGSALFEVISHMPQYGLTRADERLLRRHSGEIVDRLAGPVAVAELGSQGVRGDGGWSAHGTHARVVDVRRMDGRQPARLTRRLPAVRMSQCGVASE